MELFVYDWFYNGYTVYGHSLDDNGEYHLLKVTNFTPACYVEGETVRTSLSTVAPRDAEYRRMLSSRDVSTLKPFYRLSFSNMKEMEQFSSSGRQPCYMADIPQISMFLSQTGADNVGWVRVASEHCKVSEVVSAPDKIPFASPRVMVFDIEVKSMDSGMPQPHRITDTVEMISVVLFGDNKDTKTFILHVFEPFNIEGAEDVVCDSEIELITKFFTMVKQEDPTVLTGFNIYGFDIHYLVSRLRLRLVEIPDVSRGVANSISLIKVDWSSDAYGHNKYDRLVIGGRVIIDMYLYFKRMKLDKYSLQFISGKFLGEGKDDMPYAKMADAFESRDHDVLREVARYCIKDSVLVMKLFEKVQMWIDACEVSKITKCSIEDIYTRGEQMKMISQCVAECTKRNIVLQPQEPSEWKQYEGAYVLEPTKGVYDSCSILDFQSLYPSIIIAYNICPSTYCAAGGKHVHKCGGHSFVKEPIGLLPGMIKRILDERRAVKDKMKSAEGLEYIVLNRRQNALKICANSVYGMMGFKNSRYFGHVGCAESVTTIGRELLTSIVGKIENTYPVKVVYGDSVTGYTPTIVRINKKYVYIETFENIGTRWGESRWAEHNGKESCELHGVEVWTDKAWTTMYRVIRHVLNPKKRVVRVVTSLGVVDVTDEHSLLGANGALVDASRVKVGDELLHHSYPRTLAALPLVCNVCCADTRASKALKAVAGRTAAAPGCQAADAACAVMASTMGYNVSFSASGKILINDKKSSAATVKSTYVIPYAGYVYDATTDNNHFQAGPGQLIVHNTDSCMLWYGKGEKGDIICNSLKICKEITASLPEPMALNFETYCDKVILLTKKRYVLVSDGVISYKGVMNARRDYCKYAKDTYGCVMELIAKGEHKEKIAGYIDKRMLRLFSGDVALEDVVVTKSMAKPLATYKVNQPHVVLARRLVKKTGIDIPAGTRLEYVYVKNEGLVTPEEFESGCFKIDGRFYVEKQLATQIDDVLSTIGMEHYIKDSWT